MPQRLKRLLALWFALQIVLPFTAPLQTCDLADLLGTKPQHRAPISHESTTTPTTNETESEANAFVSPLEASTLQASATLAVVRHEALAGPVMSAFSLSPSPQVQQTVLRL